MYLLPCFYFRGKMYCDRILKVWHSAGYGRILLRSTFKSWICLFASLSFASTQSCVQWIFDNSIVPRKLRCVHIIIHCVLSCVLYWLLPCVTTRKLYAYPSKHDINGPFVVSVKATNGRNGSMASHLLSQMARFSVAICLPFKACHEPAVNGLLKASHFSAI